MIIRMPADGEDVRDIGTTNDTYGCGSGYGAFEVDAGWGWGDGWCDEIAWGDTMGDGGAPTPDGFASGARRPMHETWGRGVGNWINQWYDDQQE